jgi:hypothetical protein
LKFWRFFFCLRIKVLYQNQFSTKTIHPPCVCKWVHTRDDNRRVPVADSKSSHNTGGIYQANWWWVPMYNVFFKKNPFLGIHFCHCLQFQSSEDYKPKWIEIWIQIQLIGRLMSNHSKHFVGTCTRSCCFTSLNAPLGSPSYVESWNHIDSSQSIIHSFIHFYCFVPLIEYQVMSREYTGLTFCSFVGIIRRQSY